jgi:hypothetical protein
MPITKKSGRQQVVSAYVDFVFGDVSPSGVGQAAIDLPVGAQVVGGDFVISQAFNSATSDTFTIGDATLATRYGNAIAAPRHVPLSPSPATSTRRPSPLSSSSGRAWARPRRLVPAACAWTTSSTTARSSARARASRNQRAARH